MSSQLDQLFADVDEVHFVDFPDYPNVGDSAIALGMFSYFRSRGIKVLSVHSIQTLGDARKLTGSPVFINGGGNLGGLYPIADRHRLLVAQKIPSSALLIQGPQTVDFISQSGRSAFLELLDTHDNFRIAVRDEDSRHAVIGTGLEPILAADPAHLLSLSQISASASQALVNLSRNDKEAVTSPQVQGVDWLQDSPLQSFTRTLRHASRRISRLSELLNPSQQGWEQIAHKRLRRGVKILSIGQVVVTDRLHGMILAHSMGRQVVVVDNVTKKLSRYLQTWGHALPSVMLAAGWDAALEIARGNA